MAKPKRRWKVPLPYCPLPLAYIENWMPFLSPSTNVVMVVIIRATWGYQKESDVLANGEIARRGNVPLRTVKFCLRELRKHGLLKCEGPDRHAKTLTLITSRFLQKPGEAIVAPPKVLTMVR